MKKTEQFLTAVALANDSLAESQLLFEKRLIEKRIELALPAPDDQAFQQHARNARATLVGLKAQDDQAAKSAAGAKKAE